MQDLQGFICKRQNLVILPVSFPKYVRFRQDNQITCLFEYMKRKAEKRQLFVCLKAVCFASYHDLKITALSCSSILRVSFIKYPVTRWYFTFCEMFKTFPRKNVLISPTSWLEGTTKNYNSSSFRIANSAFSIAVSTSSMIKTNFNKFKLCTFSIKYVWKLLKTTFSEHN